MRATTFLLLLIASLSVFLSSAFPLPINTKFPWAPLVDHPINLGTSPNGPYIGHHWSEPPTGQHYDSIHGHRSAEAEPEPKAEPEAKELLIHGYSAPHDATAFLNDEKADVAVGLREQVLATEDGRSQGEGEKAGDNMMQGQGQEKAGEKNLQKRNWIVVVWYDVLRLLGIIGDCNGVGDCGMNTHRHFAQIPS